MKKVIIISLGNKTGKSLYEQLKSILDEKIYVNFYSIENHIPENLECDLIIFSSDTVKDIIISKITINSKYIIARRIIKNQFIDELINIPTNQDVLVVNDKASTCEVAIQQLKSHGINHINYYPYYPGIEEYKKLEVAITPGEANIVPSCVKRIIYIGPRIMDITSIVEVLISLECINEYADRLSSYFFRNMIITSKRYINMANHANKVKEILEHIIDNSQDGIIYTNTNNEVLVFNNMIITSKRYINMANHANKVKEILEHIIDNSQDGIIYTNTNNEVLVFNKKAISLLKLNKENLISRNIYEVCPKLKGDIANINDKEVFIDRRPIYVEEILAGYMINISILENIQKIDEELRRKKKDSNLQAKYTFNDMIGSSSRNLKNINLAKKIANSNSTVLIQGESGTGKEILAQAIHNHSDRSKYPFVAINFAALSENLLESELFGYEEGAFTGAKKGGKVGLFKKAHKGTIFLDEIGDAPYHFQARLLRVIQEREITPVGATEITPIDVRIIAATNKNLLEEVEKNNFREDLFYRLNVMPISTLPLRDRKEDIEQLIRYYLMKNKVFISLDDFLEEETLKFFYEYNWPGNIRELINIVEYLINIREDEKIKIEDLPLYMQRNTISNKDLSKQTKILDKDTIWVLDKIYKYNRIGRRSLALIAEKENKDLGEGKIRTLLSNLQKESFIKINKGKKGTEILEKGIEMLKSQN